MRNKIKTAIQAFTSKPMLEAARELFKILGYESQRVLIDNYVNFEGFKRSNDTSSFKEDKALVDEWLSINLLFQITSAELNGIKPYVFEHKVKHSFLFMCVELKGHEYSRTKIAQISREINKVYKMPVLILFKYNNLLTLSVMDKRKNKNDDNKDVILKITMIKDISIVSPHRAHLDILLSLSLAELSTEEKKKIENFDDLQKAWEKVLDIQELNKKFYTELSNWYFWAINEVRFPNGAQKGDDKAKEQNEMNLIRMLTRLLFVWFIKERDLVPRELFELDHLNTILKQEIDTKKDSEREPHEQQSIYYKSILQNLFFATLNQEVGQRRFRKEKDERGTFNLLRYKNTFNDPDAFAKLLDDNVPFLNGGLFECLDYVHETEKGPRGGDVIVRIDDFSDHNDNVISVPDYLFFSAEETANFSVKGKKSNKVKIHGLINILNNFKFTIEENTPIEEDIALDPELLGRVFENLLATYNPETKETARKETGSFYTPREVVNFMVDESLKAYLIQSLVKETKMKEKDAEVGIDFLISYSEKEHVFNEGEVDVLIKAIDNCKIIDPACGSGAFPMGILHKQVHILQKLDPDNELWKDRQIENAHKIDDAEIREEAIKAIETSFQNKGMDYGRKLYLIENCIYGVDIQPIAIQISKLRFFISLIVDQNANENKEDNFGLKALPNLETKFVAANSLLKLEKPKMQMTLSDLTGINELENELKSIRHRLFSAKKPKKKRELREKDKDIRGKISKILEGSGWSNKSAEQLSIWDPYNQNVSSTWFDTEWMFGLEDGFDIVIGNPPYIQLQKMKYEKILKDYQDQKYIVYHGKGDLYCLFYEQGINILKKNAFLCYITSNKWMRTGYGEKLRGFFAEQNPKLLIDLGGGVFANATVDTNILLIEKNDNKNELKGLNYYEGIKNLNEAVKDNAIIITEVSSVGWFIGNSAEISLK
ncbi:MAG TPA: N-6 DNA methylase, partial [Candidatus Cloacimonadota bacterium]|nr:N-6 DNA methylase [Candidatus Cloacimonadota bacterium]HQB41848.1 N-6 DNA methylase [Candidatus Cloacimonadota bacterium]